MTATELKNIRKQSIRVEIGEQLDLKPMERTFYNLRFVELMSVAEAARAMCRSYSTVAHLSMEVNNLLKDIKYPYAK